MSGFSDLRFAAPETRTIATAPSKGEISSMSNPPIRVPPSIIEAIERRVGPERMEWYSMTPAERWEATGALWINFLALKGSLDPNPDPERPGDPAAI